MTNPVSKMSQMSPNVASRAATFDPAELADDATTAALLELPEIQQRALLSLVEGAGMAETANLVGVDRRTVYRWTIDPEFSAVRREVLRKVRRKQMRSLIRSQALLALLDSL